MFFIVFAIIIQAVLIASVPINIFPELSLYPWLVAKGILPFRDFFDHHGFLLYYLIAPFAPKAYFIAIQSINLAFVILILKKFTRWYVFFTALYVVINFFVAENNLWYEQTITTGYLLILLVIPRRKTLIGVIAGLLSLIKPIAAIILVPILLFSFSFSIIISFILVWIGAIALYSSHLQEFFRGIITYNTFLLNNYQGNPLGLQKLLLYAAILITLTLPFIFKRTGLLLLAMLASTFVFLRLTFGKEHLTPAATTFVLLLGWGSGRMKGLYKWIFFGMVALLMIFLVRQIKHFLPSLITHRINEQKQEQEIAKIIPNYESIYIFGDRPTLYVALNKLPPTYYPIDFPMIEYFDKQYENRIIDALEKKHVEAILEPLPQSARYLRFSIIRNYIQTHYSPVFENNQVRVYQRLSIMLLRSNTVRSLFSVL